MGRGPVSFAGITPTLLATVCDICALAKMSMVDGIDPPHPRISPIDAHPALPPGPWETQLSLRPRRPARCAPCHVDRCKSARVRAGSAMSSGLISSLLTLYASCRRLRNWTIAVAVLRAAVLLWPDVIPCNATAAPTSRTRSSALVPPLWTISSARSWRPHRVRKSRNLAPASQGAKEWNEERFALKKTFTGS
jgi:hypothetical protein